MKTDYNVIINVRNGAWGELEVSSDEHLNLHMAATCLHYGQESFEGLKDVYKRQLIHLYLDWQIGTFFV